MEKPTQNKNINVGLEFQAQRSSATEWESLDKFISEFIFFANYFIFLLFSVQLLKMFLRKKFYFFI